MFLLLIYYIFEEDELSKYLTPKMSIKRKQLIEYIKKHFKENVLYIIYKCIVLCFVL